MVQIGVNGNELHIGGVLIAAEDNKIMEYTEQSLLSQSYAT